MHLHEFFRDFKAGKRPKLVLMAPPQHGKTTQITDFISWCSGWDPNLKMIYSSYSDDLGTRVNGELQRIYSGDEFRFIFPGTMISDTSVVTKAGRYLRNSSVIEFVGRHGSFRNTTVQGQITGMGLDLGFIDDPIKGRAEASSKVQRDKAWNWLTDDFFSRFSDKAGMLMIMTRWHIDDPMGRWLQHFPDTKVLKYRAIATENEAYRKKGEALFSAHKSLQFLMERKKLMTDASWEALYQQEPYIVGGGLFPIEKFKTLNLFDRSKIRESVRYIDKAGTEGAGAFTAMVLMHALTDKTFVVEHVARGQWSALEREEKIKFWAHADAKRFSNYRVVVEQEPGSGGKESAEGTIRNLAGLTVLADKVTGNKEIRAEPYAAQVQGGNVSLIAGDWQNEFLDEHESFPNGKFKDQVDAAAGAFAQLVKGTNFDSSFDWA